jgi:hypothetical protein
MRFLKGMAFFLSLNFSAYAENSLPELPTDIQAKTASEQAEILGQIAEFSYQVLIEVPEKGLQIQRAAIEDIISTRQWLETTQLPLFQLLALRLHEGVDRAIVNEMYRKEMTRHGYTVHTPFKEGSFDLALIENLLNLNEFSEQAAIEYAISLDGQIGPFCRQENYPYEIYSKGLILRRVSTEIKSLVQEILNTFGLVGQMTEQEVSDFLFSQTLLGIDKARDVRLAAQVYQTAGGFPQTSRELRELINSKLPLYGAIKGRLSTGYALTPSDVIGTLELYVSIRPFYYGYSLTLLLFPFLPNIEPVPEDYRQPINDMEVGQWLTLAEEES